MRIKQRPRDALRSLVRLLLLVSLVVMTAGIRTALAAPTSAPTIGGTDRMVFFTMSYGFEQGKAREPSQDEIEELVCLTNTYIQDRVQAALPEGEDRPVQAFATNIDWDYAGDDAYLNFVMTFTADIKYATSDGEFVDADEIVFPAFELQDGEISTYITDHVWLTSFSSVFYQTVRVNYNVKKNVAVTSTGKLQEATCEQTRVPTVAPLTDAPLTSSPTTPPPSLAPTFAATYAPTSNPSTSPSTSVAPTMYDTVPFEDVDHMVYFQLDITLASNDDPNNGTSRTGPPLLTQDDVATMMCHIDTFFQQRVQDAVAVPVTSKATNVFYLVSDSGSGAAMTVYFTSDTTYSSSGELVPLESVAASVEGADADLLWHLRKSRASQVLSTISALTLQDLPLETPVRVGILEDKDCSFEEVDAEPPLTTTDAPSAATIGPSRSGDLSDLDMSKSSLAPSEAPTVFQTINASGPESEGNVDGNSDSSRASSLSLFPEPTMTITVDFLVSNLNSIQDPNDIIQLGLAQSFPVFIQDLVESLERSRSSGDHSLRRNLGGRPVALDPNSSPEIYQAIKTPCGPYAHPDLTCHEVKSRFDLLMPTTTDDGNEDGDQQDAMTTEEAAEIRRVYQVGTYEAINDGTFYSVMKRLVPDTPLYIGAVPPAPSSDNQFLRGGSPADYAMLVLMLLLALLCCCVLGCIFHRWIETRREDRLVVQHLHSSSTATCTTTMTPGQAYDEEMTRQEAAFAKGLYSQELQEQEEQQLVVFQPVKSGLKEQPERHRMSHVNVV